MADYVPKPAAAARQKAKADQVDEPGPDLSKILAAASVVVPVSQVDFHPKNPRDHSEEQIAKIRASIRDFGQVLPIVANTKGHDPWQVIAGNGRLTAILAENFTHVAVVPVEMSEERAAAFAIADNALSLDDGATWNKDILAETMRLAQTAEQDLAAALFTEPGRGNGDHPGGDEARAAGRSGAGS